MMNSEVPGKKLQWTNPDIVPTFPTKGIPTLTQCWVLVWSNSPESYAGGRADTVRASHARQVKGDDPDKKEYPGPPDCPVGHRADNPTP